MQQLKTGSIDLGCRKGRVFKMDIREEIEKIIEDGYDEFLAADFKNRAPNQSIEGVAGNILTLITPKDIEWAEECERCKLEWQQDRDDDNSGNCPECNGTGKITRPATLEEVLEVLPKILRLTSEDYSCQCNLCYCGICAVRIAALTVNNGQLRIKEPTDE